MVDYITHTRNSEQVRSHRHVRQTTVRSNNSTGVLAAIVLFVLLGTTAFVFWTADDYQPANNSVPAAQSNDPFAPGANPARPVPAPDGPLIAPDATAPAAPGTTTSPAPASNG